MMVMFITMDVMKLVLNPSRTKGGIWCTKINLSAV